MAMIIIKCPKTQQDVRTGITMDKASFAAALFSNNSVRCPHCRDIHVWTKKDATLKE